MRDRVCDECGEERSDVLLTLDPFELRVNSRKRERLMCDDCDDRLSEKADAKR